MKGTFSPYCSVMRVFNMKSSSPVPIESPARLSPFETVAMRGASQVDDNFSLRVVISEGVVGALDGRKGEATRVNQWNELASFDESSGLCENAAVVSATLAGKKRQQRENTGIRGALEGQGSKRVAAPSEAAHHVAEAAHRVE